MQNADVNIEAKRLMSVGLSQIVSLKTKCQKTSVKWDISGYVNF